MDASSATAVQRAFAEVSRGGRSIDYRGLVHVLHLLGLRSDPSLVQVMVAAADADLSGFLDLADVLNALDYALLRSLPLIPPAAQRHGRPVRVRRRKDQPFAPVPALSAGGAPGPGSAGTGGGASATGAGLPPRTLTRADTEGDVASAGAEPTRTAIPSAPAWTPQWWMERLEYGTRLGVVLLASLFVPTVLIYLGYTSPAAFRPVALSAWHLAFFLIAMVPMLACSARSYTHSARLRHPKWRLGFASAPALFAAGVELATLLASQDVRLAYLVGNTLTVLSTAMLLPAALYALKHRAKVHLRRVARAHA
eukprot:CAMPEP_0185167344 /NCGR_PEP_ID=MMETSP1139-20130426/14097_1 /TAXON_ID=298111 /ORGANISM="Pavlova sp., Strain CCMP459" /LENGTH=309 /DNA_ID=CAMNT_0027732821 /DNA_START=28 /DNA_END=953 /DNA_ORIENTATION=+